MLNQETFTIFIFSLIFTSIGIIHYLMIGLPVVETFTGSLNQRSPLIYMIPIYTIFGISFGELITDYITNNDLYYQNILLFELLAILVISYLRLSFIIPISGHGMILTYFLLTQIIIFRNKNIGRVVIGLAILIITLYFKVLVWNDPITFILGSLFGLTIFLSGFSLKKRSPSFINRVKGKI